VDPRAGLDEVEKRKFLTLPGLELRHLGRPAHSQSLYRLSYPGSYDVQVTKKFICFMNHEYNVSQSDIPVNGIFIWKEGVKKRALAGIYTKITENPEKVKMV
jgi:hypothetical protein